MQARQRHHPDDRQQARQRARLVGSSVDVGGVVGPPPIGASDPAADGGAVSGSLGGSASAQRPELEVPVVGYAVDRHLTPSTYVVTGGYVSPDRQL